MHCEICGKEIEKGYFILVEGSQMLVCEECKKFGRVLKERKKPRRKVLSTETEVEEYDVASTLKKVMKNEGIGLKELARKLKVKESLIKHILEDKLVPSKKLIDKIERVFHVKVEKRKVIKPEKRKVRDTLTLGDVVELR